METTANGFDLAEQDLKLRGPGDVLGTSQSGLKGVRFEEWLLDARLIHRGRELAEAILAEDPNLESAKYRPPFSAGKRGGKTCDGVRLSSCRLLTVRR